jgi:hypothetical protein
MQQKISNLRYKLDSMRLDFPAKRPWITALRNFTQGGITNE